MKPSIYLIKSLHNFCEHQGRRWGGERAAPAPVPQPRGTQGPSSAGGGRGAAPPDLGLTLRTDPSLFCFLHREASKQTPQISALRFFCALKPLALKLLLASSAPHPPPRSDL